MSSIALASGLAGCTPKPPPPPGGPEFSVPLCKVPASSTLGSGGNCTNSDCGGNSPVVNGFPLNGLSKEATSACNPAGVQLIPHSLQGGHCGVGADLGLDPTGTRLIGTRLNQVVCTGEELTGASFLVRSFAAATEAFMITNVRHITMLHGNRYEGYRIESGGASVCEPATALRIRSQLGLSSGTAVSAAALPKPAGYQSGPNDDLVIAVDGPLYDLGDSAVTDSRGHWFNLACAGDALGKRSLFDLYTASNDDRNLTALRMLTANYCGKPYTVPGMELEWDMREPPNEQIRVEEARWHAGKAICISTPRLMILRTAQGDTPILPADLPDRLQPKGCEAHNCDAKHWTLALRAECNVPSCSVDEGSTTTFEFESFVESEQNRIIVAKH